MKEWHPITWPNSRPDFLAWRFIDDTETGIEVLAYNNAYGDVPKSMFLERADSLKAIGGPGEEYLDAFRPVAIKPGESFAPPAELSNFAIGQIHAGLLIPNGQSIKSMSREIRKWRGIENPDSI